MAPGPDQIVSSNTYGLAAMAEAAGAEARVCPIARDTPDSLRESLQAARGADFVVTIGGASVGDHDIVADVFGAEGLSLDFYRIAMRPGKPLMAGRIGDAVMLGLPGNPVSAMVCGEIFLRPALDAALGLPGSARSTVTLPLATPVDANGPREHYMRARLVTGPEGDQTVAVAERQDSSLLSVLQSADVLVRRDVGAPAAPAGTPVPCILLDRG